MKRPAKKAAHHKPHKAHKAHKAHKPASAKKAAAAKHPAHQKHNQHPTGHVRLGGRERKYKGTSREGVANMPNYEVVNQPSGLLNGQEWPEVGETVDLPESVGQDMVATGWLKAKAKPAKKAAAKKAETATASKANVETRKS